MDSTLQIDQYSNQERIKKLVSTFEREFDGKKPEAVIRVPGRVNLIGEHIDYCGYGVHPMAIEQDILVAVAYSNGMAFKIIFSMKIYENLCYSIGVHIFKK